MQFNIPQFIDKEDKIVGPLTAKQLGWLAGAGVVMLVIWSSVDQVTFFIAAVPIVAVFSALAFFRPNGQSLISFILSSIYYVVRPKLYVWDRIPEKTVKKIVKKQKIEPIRIEKKINERKIEDIAKLLDQNRN